MSKPIMSIIGFGPMGKRFTRLFSKDFDVRVCSSRNVKKEAVAMGAAIVSERQLAIAKARYIFLAVPLKILPEMIEDVNTHAKAGVVVIDCCSARVEAERVMQNLNHQHFGMHDVKSGEYCITGDIDDLMTAFFRKNAIPVVHVSPEEHDRINAVIGIGHFIGLSLDRFLSRKEKDILSGAGSGAKLMSLINGLVGNTPTTWQETQIDNQFTKEMRVSFLGAINQYHTELSNGEYPFLQNKTTNRW